MLKTKLGGMKCLPAQLFERTLSIVWKPQGARLKTGAICCIAQKWVTNVGHVNADLVRAACFEFAAYRADPYTGVARPKRFNAFVVGDRIFSALDAGCHFRPVCCLARDGSIHGSFRSP